MRKRATAQTSSDAIIRNCLPLIPLRTSRTAVLVSVATANVDLDQGTANISHSFSDAIASIVYYAIQRDLRGEPPTTQGNNLPGYGDHRRADVRS